MGCEVLTLHDARSPQEGRGANGLRRTATGPKRAKPHTYFNALIA